MFNQWNEADHREYVYLPSNSCVFYLICFGCLTLDVRKGTRRIILGIIRNETINGMSLQRDWIPHYVRWIDQLTSKRKSSAFV